MQFTINLTWQDYLEAELYNWRTGQRTKFLFIPAVLIIGVLIILLTVVSFLQGNFSYYFLLSLIIVFALAAVFLLLRYVVLPRRIRQIYNQQKSLQLPTRVTITPEAYIMDSELGHSAVPWSDFIRWADTGELILLFHSDIMMNAIPRRDIPDEETLKAILDCLQTNNVVRK